MKKTPIKYLASESLHGGQFALLTELIKQNYHLTEACGTVTGDKYKNTD